MTVVVTGSPLSPTALHHTRVQGQDIGYQVVGGHTVPVRQHGAHSYLFTGDLDEADLLELAAEAAIGR